MDEQKKTEEKKVFVNDRETTQQELQEIQSQKNKRLTEVSPDHYRVLDRMQG